MGGGFDGDSLDIYARFHPEEASAGFESLYEEANRAGVGITEQNLKIEQSARSAADAIGATTSKISASGPIIREISAAQMKEIDDLKARFASIGGAVDESVKGAKASLAGLSAELVAMQRSLQTIKDDARAGAISPTGRVNALEDLRTRTLGNDDRETLQSKFQARDPEGTARYTQLVAIERELQNARKATADVTKAALADEEKAQAAAADEIVASVKSQTQALREQVQLRKVSLEEEGESLARLRDQYAANADAIAIIDRRRTSNELEQMRERDRAQKESGRGGSDALLNAGYLIPGPVGNVATNLGYLGMGGPTGLAVGGAAMAGIGAAAGIGTVAKAAGEDQEALEKLKIAVEDQGGSWKTASAEIEAFLDVQTRSTTFGRDQTLPALQALVDGGVKYGDALKIVRVAEDASAGSGKSLEEVAQSLQRAYEGYPRALTAMGLATKDQIHDGMEFSDVLKLIESRYADQATATDGYTRSQKQFQNAVADLERQIGDGLTGALTSATKDSTAFIQSLNGEGVGKGIGGAISDTEKLASAFGDLASKLKPVYDAYAAIADLDIKVNATLLSGAGAVIGYIRDHPGGVLNVNGANTPATPTAAPGSQYDSTISRYAQQYGVDPRVAAALFSQESSGDPNARGRYPDGTLSGALGLGQLTPGTAKDMGVTNALDPDQNIAGSLKYLAEQLKTFHGDLRLALTAYNAGPGATERLGLNARLLPGADPNYAESILRRLGPSLYNPVDTNVSSPNVVGGPRAPSPFAQSLTNAQLLENAEGGSKNATALSDYIEQLRTIESDQKSISQDQTKSAADRATALKNVVEVEAKITAAQREQASLETAAQRAAEQRLSIAERQADIARKAQSAANPGDPRAPFTREISTLSALSAQRAGANDQFSARDVDAISAKIQDLEKQSDAAWSAALTNAGNYYRKTSESLDDYIARVRSLERGATPQQKTTAEADITTALETSVKKTVSDLETEYRRAIQAGLSRAGQEDLARYDLGVLANTRNRGDATAASDIAGGQSMFTGDLSGDRSKDATDAITTLDQKYKDLADDINATGALQSTKDRELAAATADQIAALTELGKQYAALGPEGAKAFEDIQAKVAALSVTERGYLDDATKATRAELLKQADDYQKFADTASEHLASIFEKGAKGAGGLRDTFKAAIKDMEQSLLSSTIESAFFGVPSSSGPTDALQKAFFGAVDPMGKSKDSATQAALQKIANSPTGDTNNPLTVQLTPASTQALTGSSTGVAPGSPFAVSTSGSGGSSPLGALSGILGGSGGGGAGSLLTLGLGLVGALSGGGGSPSNQPDRTNGAVYGQTIANLTGSAGANGTSYYEDPATYKAFGATTGLAGVGQLLAAGPTQFTQQTGMSAAQYAQYLKMFGSSSTGSGSLSFDPNNIGVESVTGAAGASGSYTYQQFGTALTAITNALGVIGAGGPINSYTFSRYGNGLTQTGSSMVYPTTSQGGPGYGGPSVSEITAGASQYGLVGGVLGAHGGSALLGSLSTTAGIVGLFLGPAIASQMAGSQANSTPADPTNAANSNSVILGALGAAAGASSTGATSYIPTAGGGSVAVTGAGSGGFLQTIGQRLLGGGSSSSGASFYSSGNYAPGQYSGGYSGPDMGAAVGGGSDWGNNPFLSNSSGLGGTIFGAGTNSAGMFNASLQGLSLGMGLNSLLGGNQTNGGIGAAIGAGVGLIGGPVGSLIGGSLGGILGGLFGSHTTAATSPDIYNTAQYGGITADLVGTAGANGTSFYEDSSTYKAFNGQTGLAGVEELLSGGQQAFTEETGLSAAQYAQYLKMFGSSATGAGTLSSQKNIGQKYVNDTNGVTGASGVYSYLQYGQALAAIESGISTTGVVGPYDSYTFSRSYPNYNTGTLSAGTPSLVGGATVTGSGAAVGAGGNVAATGSASADAIANGAGAITISGNTFVGTSSETLSSLATMIANAQKLQARGLLTDTSKNVFSRTPVS